MLVAYANTTYQQMTADLAPAVLLSIILISFSKPDAMFTILLSWMRYFKTNIYLQKFFY